MLLDDCKSFILIEFLVVWVIYHIVQGAHQIFDFDFTVNIFVSVDPSAVLYKLVEYWGFGPIGILQDSEQSIKMNLLDEGLFTFHWIWNLTANSTEFDWPIE